MPDKLTKQNNRLHDGSVRRASWKVLLPIILLSASLRLVNLGQLPPGLNQDEAVIAWNAYCLYQTGKDQLGVPWPIFYCRALSVSHDMISVYAAIPFQAIGGINTVTTRLPAAIGGILTVLLIYLVAARLFDQRVGLIAAALLAVNPWHLQQSRWGHEAPLCPLLIMLTLALFLWANLPFNGDEKRRPRILLAAAAGAMLGISCYGYAAIKLFLPTFFLTAILLTWRSWFQSIKTRRGAVAICVMLAALAVTFGPLAWKHLTDSKMVMRGQSTFIWKQGESAAAVAGKIIGRYVRHFLPDFLFVNGDSYFIQSPPGIGQFHWYVLPLMVLGAIVLLRRLRGSNAARILLAWILTYPAADVLSKHPSAHALRSLPGMCGLIILAALGAAVTGKWLWKRTRPATILISVGLIIAAVVLNVRYLHNFFGQFNRRPDIYHAYHVDLLEACRWLKPRFDEADAVFCTTKGMNQPYIITTIALEYDPSRWLSDVREYTTPGEWDIYTRYGKMHFMYGDSFVQALNNLRENARPDRVIFIVRPGELGLNRPNHVVRRPDGAEVLWVHAVTL
ncbi:MAG: glycosyltransferase family 39 protein [Planctomycetes bacterium]|nr:glycosyltransferase family 39 protein [Planctomycetota bacterium]